MERPKFEGWAIYFVAILWLNETIIMLKLLVCFFVFIVAIIIALFIMKLGMDIHLWERGDTEEAFPPNR